MMHRTCKDCGACKPASEYRVTCGGRTWFNAMCRSCKSARTALANAACKARKRAASEPEGPRPFIPPADFLPMGEPDRTVPLVSFVEGRVNRNPASNALEVDPWDRRVA